MFFSLLLFSLNLYKSKESQTDTREKENRNNNKVIIWKLSLTKVKETNLPEKPDCILKKQGSFIEKYFPHFMPLSGPTSIKQLNLRCLLFFVVIWIYI